MIDLPATVQTILGEFWGAPVSPSRNWQIAAALRAAADQVVPAEPLHGGDQRWFFERDTRQACRKQLFAIADELERRE